MRLIDSVPSFSDAPAAMHRGDADLGRCKPGEILGELGIVHRRLRSATVLTRASATVLHLERSAFERLHAEHACFRVLVGEAVLCKTT